MSGDLGFIHRYRPPSTPGATDTLLVLHGTGGNEDDLIGIAQTVAPGAAVISPRGKVLEGGAPRFFRRLAEGVFDPAEVRSRAGELAQFIRDAAGRYELDPTRIYALGYSNGANMASTVMLIEPGVIRAAVLLRPMLVYEAKEKSDLTGTAVLISAGRVDPIVPVESVEKLAAQLEKRGAEVTLKWQLGGHNLVPSEIKEAADWLALQRARP
ncbi:MAG TPA: alpha/beta hydrolase [Gemmatimonadaceae bacterium]|nr:alpha/beta hydrolase [Gemmatimonadaceae bacterium]